MKAHGAVEWRHGDLKWVMRSAVINLGARRSRRPIAGGKDLVRTELARDASAPGSNAEVHGSLPSPAGRWELVALSPPLWTACRVGRLGPQCGHERIVIHLAESGPKRTCHSPGRDILGIFGKPCVNSRRVF